MLLGVPQLVDPRTAAMQVSPLVDVCERPGDPSREELRVRFAMAGSPWRALDADASPARDEDVTWVWLGITSFWVGDNLQIFEPPKSFGVLKRQVAFPTADTRNAHEFCRQIIDDTRSI